MFVMSYKNNEILNARYIKRISCSDAEIVAVLVESEETVCIEKYKSHQNASIAFAWLKNKMDSCKRGIKMDRSEIVYALEGIYANEQSRAKEEAESKETDDE